MQNQIPVASHLVGRKCCSDGRVCLAVSAAVTKTPPQMLGVSVCGPSDYRECNSLFQQIASAMCVSSDQDQNSENYCRRLVDYKR